MTQTIDVASTKPFALVVHGGAGGHHWRLDDAREAAFRAGLQAAYAAGEQVLVDSGTALDACVAAVTTFEENPLFNAGIGASLTSAGTVEHDAAVMTGDGRSGGVTLARRVRHPIWLARAILDTPEVLIADPPDAFVKSLGLDLCANEFFVIDERREKLAALQASQTTWDEHKHGTVGAVAVDVSGYVAAATSTGGYDDKPPHRVGDTPIPGHGTWAKNGVVAVSCTGRGESFMQGAVSHQLSARLEYGCQDLVTAAAATITAELTGRKTTGALIAVTPPKNGKPAHCVLAWDSPTLLACWRDGDILLTHI